MTNQMPDEIYVENFTYEEQGVGYTAWREERPKAKNIYHADHIVTNLQTELDKSRNSNALLLQRIDVLEKSESGLRYDLQFLWKCVERAKWQPEIFGNIKNVIENMALYPNAPWNNKKLWDWDTSHKGYNDEIIKFTDELQKLKNERKILAHCVMETGESWGDLPIKTLEVNIDKFSKAIELAKSIVEENDV